MPLKRKNIDSDWALSFSRSIQDTVRENFPEEKHRWPIKNDFESKRNLFGTISS